jgi:hypothetical protein
MKKIIGAIISSVLFTGCTYSQQPKVATVAATTAPQHVVIAELFTSQGCSSCPAADKLMGNYIEQNDARILPLSFHVDYWNYIGWKDPFSNKQFSKRQQQYATQLHTESVYTPQVVLNGSYETVGNNKTKVEAGLKKLAANNYKPVLTATLNAAGNGWLLKYTIAQASQYQLQIAIVQKKAVTAIANGENGGTTLKNYNVVRELITIDATPTGEKTITLPTNLAAQDALVVVYVQHKQTLAIDDAVQLKF